MKKNYGDLNLIFFDSLPKIVCFYSVSKPFLWVFLAILLGGVFS